MVQIFHHGELVKTHVRKAKGTVTDVGDYPPEKIAFHTRTPQWCRERAEQTGPATAAVIDELLDGPLLHRLRSAQAILNLAGKYSDARLEAACPQSHHGRRPVLPHHRQPPGRRTRRHRGRPAHR
jgi:hypothetical protein